MDIFSFFTLFGGLAFFIYGMNQMSGSLEKIAGGRMETIVNNMTRNRLSGLVLGAGITIAIQSSSAVTVMLVGLVNSGIMEIGNTVGVIMGSNIGTTATGWIMSLIGVSGDNMIVRMFKPESFAPVMAFIGIILIMMAKSTKKKDTGNIFVGFAILMSGMMMMSGSVSPLADSPEFAGILTAFKNPLLGIATGLVVTAVIQSSAASLGMLQALSLTGGITYGMAIPIILGQNIGTCATAIISSIGVSRNAKRVAVIHISFNVIGTIIFMLGFYGLHFVMDFAFIDDKINPVGIALCHSIFNIVTTALLLPFSKWLVKIAESAIKTEPEPQIAFLDERIFQTPGVAVAECGKLSVEMAVMVKEAVLKAMKNIHDYSEAASEEIKKIESDADTYEDHLGDYLVTLSGSDLSDEDSRSVTKMLRSIGNFERISDHARNITESADELSGKGLELSQQAQRELKNLESALEEILETAIFAYEESDMNSAIKVEPLEEVIDVLTEEIKINHIDRLRRGECRIENGFVLADILNNYERVSDHCSNIAMAVIEMESENVHDSHDYLKKVRTMENPEYKEAYEGFERKYVI